MYADHFSIANIPFGIASSASHPQRAVATRLGDNVIFLDVLAEQGMLSPLPEKVLATFSQPTLNAFAALPKSFQSRTREVLQAILSSQAPPTLPVDNYISISSATMHLPVTIGDFTDFSCSKDHVLNAGEAITGKRFLPPGFLHFPIGYAGRASSVVVSETPIRRPKGQFRDRKDSGKVIYAPTRELDYELEVACIVGKPSQFGTAISITEADENIFGLVLLNDWSARDIQGLEMIPLGPLNGKSFATSISPWVVTLDALKPFETNSLPRETSSDSENLASYLEDPKSKSTYTIHLQAEIIVDGDSAIICKSELSNMYWSMRDLIAHQTSNGCCINTGDLLATGTISGSDENSHGCLLELTKGGEVAFPVDGDPPRKRVYIEDGDVIRLSGSVSEGVGFGECVGMIMPAN